jgi:hypothetical protein
MKDDTDYCSSREKQLIIGYGVHAHHIIWGNTDIIPRGESFMEYLVSLNVNTFNEGNKPTLCILFIISATYVIIDITSWQHVLTSAVILSHF